MGKSTRPIEGNARKPVSCHREVYPAEKKVVRVDPRFSSLSGHWNEDLYTKSYDFLGGMKGVEEKKLRSEAKRLRTAKNPDAVAKKKDVKDQLLQYKYERTNASKRESAVKVKRSVRAEERGKVAAGKKPFFLKRTAQKEAELQAKYETLKKSGKLDTFLQKQRKKQVWFPFFVKI